MAEGAASVFSALHCPLDFPVAHWTPHECFLDNSTWCVQNWSSASTSPFPFSNPASLSFFISVNGIFILLVGLVRNLGFILDSFFPPFPTAHPRASPINVTFRTRPESGPVFCPHYCRPGPGCSPLDACSALLTDLLPSTLSTLAHTLASAQQPEEML